MRTWKLEVVRKQRSTRTTAEHQRKALLALRDWYTQPHAPHGGLLCLPTGAGKTFTAIRFLCEGPLSDGKKVVWLAHTHHLLDQAIETFGPDPDLKGGTYEVGYVGGTRRTLTARVVSGAPGHHGPRHIESTDDVIIATHQTLANAFRLGHARWLAFLQSARRTGLVVVFDEAHHAPANTYRALVEQIRGAVRECAVLGLTATPDYYDPRRAGWLRELFPQEIIYRAEFSQLLAAGVLAKPKLTQCPTRFKPAPAASAVREMKTRFGDLPEEVITRIATSDARNELIAGHWLAQRAEFGPTIVFADRWVQCEALRVHLERGGARVGAVYHHGVRPGEGSRAEAMRNNARALDAFRAGELDVLINVRMLTEGTDVPNARTVFLTRQTTSRILLTQMIGRALRGPRFGGTAEANIVSFIDEWGDALPWAVWDLPSGDTEVSAPVLRPTRSLEFVSVELVQAFVRSLERAPASAGRFLSWIPVGWYETAFSALREDLDDNDETEPVRRLVMVFDGEQQAFATLLREVSGAALDPFVATDLDPVVASRLAQPLVRRLFGGEARPGNTPIADVVNVLRHLAQNGSAPTFHPFERRDEHDLDGLARHILERDLGPRRVYELAESEFTCDDRLWRALFVDGFATFKAALDAAVSRAAAPSVERAATPRPSLAGALGPGDREVPEATRDVVFSLHPRCCACGAVRRLQIDHVQSYFHGGSSALENLQTLCRTCNGRKGTETLDFRTARAPRPPSAKGRVEPPRGFDVEDVDAWACYLRREFAFAYGGAVVLALEVGEGGVLQPHWQITLHEDADPAAAEDLVRAIVKEIKAFQGEVATPTQVVLSTLSRRHRVLFRRRT